MTHFSHHTTARDAEDAAREAGARAAQITVVWFEQQSSSRTLRLPPEDGKWYAVKEIWQGERLLNTYAVRAFETADEARLFCEQQRGSLVYLSASECAQRFGGTTAMWRAAAAAGRLVGATKQLPGTSAPGRVWYIPVSSADTYRRTHRPRPRLR